MTLFHAIFLGLIQGLTEFLPISSSGHLILASQIMDWPDQGLRFDTAANTGSLLAIIVYLRQELASLWQGARAMLSGRPNEASHRLAQLLVATIPVGLAGLLLGDWVAGSGRTVATVATTSIFFGVLLWVADRSSSRRARSETSTWGRVVTVGVAQALAVIPGTSRSGVTMTAGLFAGLNRVEATRLSFLLAVPVGLLVAAKDFVDLFSSEPTAAPLGPILVGFAVSAVSAYFAVHWLVRWVGQHSFVGFAIYRIVLGVILLLSLV